MKTLPLKKLAWLVPLLALAAAAWLRADEPPAPPAEKPAPAQPTAPTPAPAPETPAIAPAPEAAPASQEPSAAEAAAAAEKIREEAEKAVAAAEAAAERARELAEKAREDAQAAVEKARAQAEQAREDAQAAVEEVKKEISKIKKGKRTRTSNAGDRVVIGDDNLVAAGTTVPHDAVAVMGDLIVEGEVMNNAVAVLGDNTIDGHVHGDAVVVLGTLKLGPKAVVDGSLVIVMGEVDRDPAAVVHGPVQVQGLNVNLRPAAFTNWWDHALRIGRPLAIGAHLGWLWIVTAFCVAFYALLGLLFPKRLMACGDKLVESPGMVILAAVLAVLALPVLFVLLFITIVGIPVALLVLPVGCLFMSMFGEAAIYGVVGRKLTGGKLHPTLSVLVGATLFILLYLVPFLGLTLMLLMWFLGFGCAVLAMFARTPRPPVAAAPGSPLAASAEAQASGPAPMPAQSAGFAAAPVAETAAPAPALAPASVPPVYGSPFTATLPPVISADTLPRAGFWIRIAAAFLDFLIIAVVCGIFDLMDRGPGPLFLVLAAYSAAMWKFKGTTIGGIVCGLKVVRLDDRPIDWGVAIVRALSAFLSFFVAGLGFIWVAFDDEKQSWHDKIAGTTIVKVPKGTSLL